MFLFFGLLLFRITKTAQKLFFILLLCSPALYAMAPEPPRCSDKELKTRACELFEALSSQSLSCADNIVDSHLKTVSNTHDKHFLLQYGLKWAIEQKRFDLAKLYLLFGADQNELCFNPGNTSLLGSITGCCDRQFSHYKAEDAGDQVAFLLNYGGNPNPPDRLSHSPLTHQLIWFNDSHNDHSGITYAVCKMLFAHGALAPRQIAFYLTEDQLNEFDQAKKELQSKINDREKEMQIPLQDYYFLAEQKSCDPRILFSFQERRAKAVHNMLPLPAPLAALITAYCGAENPDITLLALMIRAQPASQREDEKRTAVRHAQDSGCGPGCIIQ